MPAHLAETREEIHESFQESYSKIQYAYPTKKEISAEDFMYAYLTVQSRTINVPFDDVKQRPDWFDEPTLTCRGLVPMFDMMNHKAKPNLHWEISDTGSIEVYTNYDIKAGAELFIDYGNGLFDNYKTEILNYIYSKIIIIMIFIIINL